MRLLTQMGPSVTSAVSEPGSCWPSVLSSHNCLSGSRSLRQSVCRLAVLSMPISFQLQQQQGQQQALGLQPVQPQQPLVSRGDCRVFWGGVRVVTGWVLSLMEMGSMAVWGEGLCKLPGHHRLPAGADCMAPAGPYHHHSECRVSDRLVLAMT